MVVLPDTAIIWDVDARIGMEVAKGDRILSYIDRGRLMVDVAIDDATIALIHPDHPVRVRLFGSGRFIDGKVIKVLGSAAHWPEKRLAAVVKRKAGTDGYWSGSKTDNCMMMSNDSTVLAEPPMPSSRESG